MSARRSGRREAPGRHSAVYTFRSPRAFTSALVTGRRPFKILEIETSPPREGANTSVAVDGLTQQLDNIGIIEKVPDLSKIAVSQQLGIAFAMCGFGPWRHF
jgi:hypothetical protein